MPDFLKIAKEVTDDPAFSMYNLSKLEPSNADKVKLKSQETDTEIPTLANGTA